MGKHNPIRRFFRLLYYRLILPIKRSRDRRRVIARGVGIGLLMGFTPTVGLQMYLIFCFWLLVGKGMKWQFNLVIAIAWSWISNPLTMIPLYYLFFVTGEWMFMEHGNINSFEQFAKLFSGAKAPSAAGTDLDIWGSLQYLWRAFGLKIFVGWIPYSLTFGFFGYHLTMWLLSEHKRARPKNT